MNKNIIIKTFCWSFTQSINLDTFPHGSSTIYTKGDRNILLGQFSTLEILPKPNFLAQLLKTNHKMSINTVLTPLALILTPPLTPPPHHSDSLTHFSMHNNTINSYASPFTNYLISTTKMFTSLFVGEALWGWHSWLKNTQRIRCSSFIT